jgi:hypothetical protein
VSTAIADCSCERAAVVCGFRPVHPSDTLLGYPFLESGISAVLRWTDCADTKADSREIRCLCSASIAGAAATFASVFS